LLWHGEAVKPVGLLNQDRALVADVAPVCSEIGRKYRCAEFALSVDQVPVIGAPRNDRLLTADREAVRRQLGWAPGEEIWLWLPTYRGALPGGWGGDNVRSANGLPFDSAALADLSKLLAPQNVTLVLKPHPLASVEMQDVDGRLRLMRQAEIENSGVSLYETLAAVDGLVTDASSVWIDYLLTQRPVIFAFPDIDEYRSRRGLNLEPYEEWAPGPFAYDIPSLVRLLVEHTMGEDHYAGKRMRMLHRFHQYTDARSADRLLDILGL
jgi:CDP-glycerol glycerophosphotransferase (TagB/SpsB family)